MFNDWAAVTAFFVELWGVGPVFGPPKSSRSSRTTPLPVSLVRILREHRSRQVAEKFALGPAWEDHGLVFIDGRNGGRATESGSAIRPVDCGGRGASCPLMICGTCA